MDTRKNTAFLSGLMWILIAGVNVYSQNPMKGHDHMMQMQAKDSVKTVMKQADQEHRQTVCPVMGNPVSKDVYTDYKGKRIYFCCSACIEPFKKDPEKYLKQMEAQGVVPKKTPVKEEMKMESSGQKK